MEYRVEEIARAAGVGVDTVRFYQSRGLLPSPRRRGRVAIYSDDHLARLKRIRSLNRQGLTLQAVGRLLDDSDTPDLRAALLGVLAEAEGDGTYARAELAAAGGVPEEVVELMHGEGLLAPVEVERESRYTEADLASVRAAGVVLESGIPIADVLPLAQVHAAHVAAVVERAIEIFDEHVRRKADPAGEAPREEVVAAFRRLLPAVTRLVGAHFERTLVERIRGRLEPVEPTGEAGPDSDGGDA